MPHDAPQLPELIATVREFVADITPRLEGQDRYHALCAAYLLDIVARELDEWCRRDTADAAHLRAFAGVDATLPEGELVAALSRDIRAGRFDARMDELLEVLLAHVVAKVRVARPALLAPEHARD